MAVASALRTATRILAIALFLVCFLTRQADAWGLVQFRGSRNCSSDAVSFVRLCAANECCTAIAYSPADQSQSAIGAKGFCAKGRVTGKLYSAYGDAQPFDCPIVPNFLVIC